MRFLRKQLYRMLNLQLSRIHVRTKTVSKSRYENKTDASFTENSQV